MTYAPSHFIFIFNFNLNIYFQSFLAEQLRTHYVCNECGLATSSLEKLQVFILLKIYMAQSIFAENLVSYKRYPFILWVMNIVSTAL